VEEALQQAANPGHRLLLLLLVLLLPVCCARLHCI
jgi:hypothetical protein